MVPLNSLANPYILSELISSTVDANDEVPTTDLMLTWFDPFCVPGSLRHLSKKDRVVHQRTDAEDLVLTVLAFIREYMIVWHGGKGSG